MFVGILKKVLPPALLFAVVVFARAAETNLSNYFLRSWRTGSGLPDNAVSAVVQSRKGYLWIGTFGGLARFDGVRFEVFNTANEPELQSDRVTSLFEDAQGTLWIGDERGDLTCYRDGKFESLKAHETGARQQVDVIGAGSDGDVWMANVAGTLVRARDGAVCAFPNQDGVVWMAHALGKLWVDSGGKLATLKHGRLVPLNAAGGSNSIGGYVKIICPARDGGLWIVSDGRVRKWNGREWVEDLGPNPCPSGITAMLETKSGAVAIGTASDGLYLLFPDHKPLHFCQANGFPSDWIRCLDEDREGTLWVGAGSAGLLALRPGNIVVLNPPDGWRGCAALSATVSADGAIWVGTEGAGLYRFRDGQWKHFGITDGLLNQFVWCVSEDARGRIWAGTWGGGMFIRKKDSFVVPPGLENVTVPMTSILHAPDGVTWIGTVSGLIRYQGGAVKWFGEKQGLKSPDVRTIAEAPDGSVWFGMLGGGLARLKDGVLKQFHKSDGLSSEYIQCLYFDADGTLWIGTYGDGLDRFKDGRFAKITMAEGLPNNFICGIEPDSYGNFWISSHGGIFRVSRKALNRCADGKAAAVHCLTFGKGEGMPSLECSGGLQPAAARMADGRICFPTIKGLVVVNPGNIITNPLAPPVVIEGVTVNGRPLPVNRQSKPAVRIVPGLHRFEIHYTALSFVAAEKMRFQYRLEGLENAWVDAGGKRVADYSYLPPGNYTFRVRACNSDGVWNESGAALTLAVLPYFWQTLWFHAVMALAGIGLAAAGVWFLARRRMHRKLQAIERRQAVERERARIAKDIHDHLGANLTRISLLSQSARSQLANPILAADQLERVYTTARDLTRAMAEIVWAINPRHDTLDSLASYLGDFAQEYLVPLGIRCRLDMPLHLPHRAITAEVRHSVFLAFKEALHNVVKHAGAAAVSVALMISETGFTLAVRDDGKGFDPAIEKNIAPTQPGHGNGLKNMRQRLEKIGGHCEIRSAPGQGAEVRFFVAVSAEARESR